MRNILDATDTFEPTSCQLQKLPTSLPGLCLNASRLPAKYKGLKNSHSLPMRSFCEVSLLPVLCIENYDCTVACL